MNDFKSEADRTDFDFVAGSKALVGDGGAVDVNAGTGGEVVYKIAIGASINGGVLVLDTGIGEPQAARGVPANE